jgi:hypothetical protein
MLRRLVKADGDWYSNSCFNVSIYCAKHKACDWYSGSKTFDLYFEIEFYRQAAFHFIEKWVLLQAS